MYNKIDMTMITMTCMRDSLILDPINISPFGNIKKKRKGIPNTLKAEEVVVETQNVGKPSSPRADSPSGSQAAQSFL